MSIVQNDHGNAVYPCRGANSVSEASLTGGGSAATIDVATALGGGRNRGNRGYVINDGAGDFTVQIAQEGVAYMTAFTLKNGENFDCTGLNISSVKITPGASNSSYRLNIW